MLGNSKKHGVVWAGRLKQSVLFALVAGSILAVLLAACSSDSDERLPPSVPAVDTVETAAPPAPPAYTEAPAEVPASAPTPLNTVIPAAIPAAVSALPTAPPAPRVFTGPVPASNIPFPTYATNTPRPLATRVPTPTSGPNPTPGPEEEIMEGARGLMASSTGVAFEVIATLDIDSGDGIEQVSVTYTGDFRPGYNVADVAVTHPNGTEQTREITSHLSFGRFTQILDTGTDNWEPYSGRPPYFVDLLKLFGLEEKFLEHLALQGGTTVDGVPYQVLNAVIRDLEVGGGQGDVEAVFRIDESDGFLKEVEITGTLEFSRNSDLLGDTAGKTATVRIAARLFDYGKTVPVVTPGLVLPLFDHQAILLDDRRVLIGSGSIGVANNDFILPFPSAAVQVCDSIKEECTLLESPVSPGPMYSLVRLADGTALAVGLGSQDGSYGSASLFDPQTSSWTALTSAPRDRALSNLALLKDGRVLVVAGLDFSGSSSPDVFREVDIFDPTTQMWHEAAPMNQAFIDTDSGPLVIALEDGQVLALGEREGDFGGAEAHAEVYDPTSDTWSTLDGLDELYSVNGGARLLDGTILVLGGMPLREIVFISQDGSQLSAEEKKAKIEARLPHSMTYDPVNQAWTPAGSMNYPRNGATVTTLPDGRVLVAGGTAREESLFEQGEEELIAFTELYDPATNTWSVGPELVIPRTNHTATILPDGRVLITGGIGTEPRSGERYPLESVEIIDPTAAP